MYVVAGQSNYFFISGNSAFSNAEFGPCPDLEKVSVHFFELITFSLAIQHLKMLNLDVYIFLTHVLYLLHLSGDAASRSDFFGKH